MYNSATGANYLLMDISKIPGAKEIKIKSAKKNKKGFVLELDTNTKKPEGKPFNYILSDGLYHLRKKNKKLLTPGGSPVTTTSEPLAARCVDHLNKDGEEYQMPYSILTFLYSYLDFGVEAPREELENSILNDTQNDWTYAFNRGSDKNMESWRHDFGNIIDRKPEIQTWLNGLEKFQLIAVVILGASLTSVNTAFVLSNIKKTGKLESFTKVYERSYHSHHKGQGGYEFFQYDQMLKIFENYLFWQNLGL